MSQPTLQGPTLNAQNPVNFREFFTMGVLYSKITQNLFVYIFCPDQYPRISSFWHFHNPTPTYPPIRVLLLGKGIVTKNGRSFSGFDQPRIHFRKNGKNFDSVDENALGPNNVWKQIQNKRSFSFFRRTTTEPRQDRDYQICRYYKQGLRRWGKITCKRSYLLLEVNLRMLTVRSEPYE